MNFAFHNNFIYISLYDGGIVELDANTLEGYVFPTDKIPVIRGIDENGGLYYSNDLKGVRCINLFTGEDTILSTKDIFSLSGGDKKLNSAIPIEITMSTLPELEFLYSANGMTLDAHTGEFVGTWSFK